MRLHDIGVCSYSFCCGYAVAPSILPSNNLARSLYFQLPSLRRSFPPCLSRPLSLFPSSTLLALSLIWFQPPPRRTFPSIPDCADTNRHVSSLPPAPDILSTISLHYQSSINRASIKHHSSITQVSLKNNSITIQSSLKDHPITIQSSPNHHTSSPSRIRKNQPTNQPNQRTPSQCAALSLQPMPAAAQIRDRPPSSPVCAWIR